jgi:transposase
MALYRSGGFSRGSFADRRLFLGRKSWSAISIMSAGGEHIEYKALYEAALQMNQQQLQKSNEQLQSRLTAIRYRLQQVTKLIKGFKWERYIPSASSTSQPELGLAFEVVTASTGLATVERITYTRNKKVLP